VFSTFLTDPEPGFSGDGLLVVIAQVVLVAGLVLGARRTQWFAGARFIGLALVGASSVLFAAVQPDSAGKKEKERPIKK